MRLVIATLALSLVVDAAAQELPAPPAAPSPPSPPSPPSLQLTPPTLQPPPPQMSMIAVRAPSPDDVRRWRDARVLSVLGSVLNSVGTGLSLASVIYVGVNNYPPSAHELLAPAKPSDLGPALAYAGASASAVGFALTAAGLGYEHRILNLLGADPGRGMFGAGTSLGLVGFAGVGASYFFGLTHYLDPHDQSVAILATSLGGTALCAIAGVLYLSDSSRLKRAWRLLNGF